MKSFYSLLVVLFLCLLLAAGRELTAQNQLNKPQGDVSEPSHNLTVPLLSEDGNWMTLRKQSWIPVWDQSDLDKDTILLFDLRKSGNPKPAGYRKKVRNMAFIGNTHLLLSNDLQTELLNLQKRTSRYFTAVKRMQVLKSNNQFVLHYNEKKYNRLELREPDGTLVNTLEHVSQFYLTGNGNIYAVTENQEPVFDVFRLKGKTTEKVYTTSQKITSLEVGADQQGMMVHKQNPEGSSPEVLYLDFKTKTAWSLNEITSMPFQRAFTDVISEGSIYFLRLWIHQPKDDTSPVDIWYGNDNRLEEKFLPSTREVYYVWEPKNKKLQQLENKQLTKSANIGNGRFFLSLDPYLLEDYSREKAPLKLYRYDRISETYTVVDTLYSQLYTSPNGQYALYLKNNNWQVYHLPSGNVDRVGDGRMKTPYFFADGKTVLFEGDGGLWRYDLEEKDIVQWNSFEGYQTTILNGTSRTTLRGFNFFEKTTGPDKPLVIKLYDPSENRSTYILWKNGQYKTIIAPTTKHIQYLDYNPSLTFFSWLEEDYNLPPRLVYKAMGNDTTVVYQSNKQDKAIRSLKQEIISYANSDGVPLKGTLYYPLDYEPDRQYPMVVHIYEKQNQARNRYPHPSYYEGLGFNIRLFLENGYFVYLPDILIQGKAGPGMDALDCVNRSLDALAHNPLINRDRIGLIGHSFGGYETDYIATRSRRFAAYISGSGHSDIIWASHAFNYNFRFPDHVRIEANVYKLGKPFSADKGLYFKNNPLYHAEKVNAPVLLWSGLDDQNVTSDHTMAFYNALRRNKKDVVALFYKKEGHGLLKPQNQLDLTSRLLDWFGYFLKGEKTETGWIEKGIKSEGVP